MTQAARGAATAQGRMTYAQFLREYEGESAEWVNGEARPMSPVTSEHDDISGFLYAIMREYVQRQGVGRVLHDKFQMKTAPNLPGREPDVMFVSSARLPELHRTWLEGPADLVIEVVSDESVERDRMTKFAEYEQGGVPEYWLLDPVAKTVDFYARGADGRYHAAAPDAAGVYESTALPGFRLDTAWLWAEPRPGVVEVMRAWGML